MASHACPICKVEVAEMVARSKAWPFCSERCRLIDLGNWLGDKYAIAGEPAEGTPDAAADSERERD